MLLVKRMNTNRKMPHYHESPIIEIGKFRFLSRRDYEKENNDIALFSSVLLFLSCFHRKFHR